MNNMPTKMRPPNNKMNPPARLSSTNDDEDDDLVLFKLSGAKAKIYHKEILAENLNSEGVVDKRCSVYSDNGTSDEYNSHNNFYQSRNNSVKLKRASSDSSSHYRRVEFYSEKPLAHTNIRVNPIESFDENLPLVTTEPENVINVKKRDISLVFAKKTDLNTANCSKVNRRTKKSVLNGIKIEEERIKRRSLPWPIEEPYLEDAEQKSTRLLRHSWYPGYDILEEDFEQDCSDKKEAFTHNLAGAKSQNPSNGTYESASLLDQNVTVNSNRGRRIGCGPTSTIQQTIPESPQASLGGPVSRKRRFEQFLKNLVGRRPSIQSTLLSSPELKINKSPSEHSILQLSKASRLANSTTSLTSVHQKLWSVVPLLKKDVSCNSLAAPTTKSQPLDNDVVKLRKCETVLALTYSSSSIIEPIKAQNRLRNCASVATCSRCSSLLSLAATGSRYSLNVSGGQFVPVNKSFSFANDQSSIYRITTSISSSSSSSNLSPTPSACSSSSHQAAKAPLITSNSNVAVPLKHTCKLCLGEYNSDNFTRITQCGCLFCTECMTAYVEFEISVGAYEVSCPDALCPAEGIITLVEINSLASNSLVEKHHRYRLNREVEMDKFRTWCPRAGCETICMVGQTPSSSDKIVQFQPSSSMLPSPCAVHCPTCGEDFCSGCKKTVIFLDCCLY